MESSLPASWAVGALPNCGMGFLAREAQQQAKQRERAAGGVKLDGVVEGHAVDYSGKDPGTQACRQAFAQARPSQAGGGLARTPRIHMM
jgi:hypothetical protein